MAIPKSMRGEWLRRTALGLAIGSLSFGALARCPTPGSLPDSASAKPPAMDPVTAKVTGDVRAKLHAGTYQAIAFGDSVMFGWKESRLARVLGMSVLDAAVGGGTETVLWQLATFDWSAQSPKLVLLFVGTNNLGRTECEVFWSIRADILALHRKFPTARVDYVSILPPGGNLLAKGPEIKAINADMKEAAGSDYTFVDAYAGFFCDGSTDCPLYQPTHMHLSDAGYDVMDRALSAVARPQAR